jgi:hypothetical protein
MTMECFSKAVTRDVEEEAGVFSGDELSKGNLDGALSDNSIGVTGSWFNFLCIGGDLVAVQFLLSIFRVAKVVD